MNEISFRGKTIYYSERDMFWRSVYHGEWESTSFDVLDKYIVPGEDFVDIGAWNGVLSVYAGLLGANVFSVEPDIEAFEELLRSSKNNPDAKITASNLAISNATGFQKINSRTIDGFGNSESSLIKREECAIEKTVFATTLSRYLRFYYIHRPCLIKMDIEGGESLVIPDSIEMLDELKPTLYISFHPGWINNQTEIFSALQRIYSVEEISKDSFVFTA